MKNDFTMIATCKLALESVTAMELKKLGARDVKACDGRVYFTGGADMLARANINLRTAERVFVQAGSFEADTFDALFEGVKALPWEQYFEREASILVKGKTAKSTLHSVSDMQALTKKAIAERLKAKYKLNWLPETGRKYIVEVGMLGNTATLALDASGAGLSRRGYRIHNGKAPLAETLAAALALLFRQEDRPFIDPMCGSGTIAIEAALAAGNIAPSLNREFAFESWRFIDAGTVSDERQRASGLMQPLPEGLITGSDIDPHELEIAKDHAKRAGVNIGFYERDVRSFLPQSESGLIVTNPPYGQRLMQNGEVEEFYKMLGKAFAAAPGWDKGIFSGHPQFERLFGKRAAKRRKLTNGGLVCQYYQYFGERI